MVTSKRIPCYPVVSHFNRFLFCEYKKDLLNATLSAFSSEDVQIEKKVSQEEIRL